MAYFWPPPRCRRSKDGFLMYQRKIIEKRVNKKTQFYSFTGENIPRKIMFWLYQDIHWGTSAFHWETISDELPEVFLYLI